MRTSALFVQKTLNFSKFMVCQHRQVRGVFLVSADKGKGVNFLRFYVNIFYGWPLITIFLW